jgi:hypothetical protein
MLHGGGLMHVHSVGNSTGDRRRMSLGHGLSSSAAFKVLEYCDAAALCNQAGWC